VFFRLLGTIRTPGTPRTLGTKIHTFAKAPKDSVFFRLLGTIRTPGTPRTLGTKIHTFAKAVAAVPNVPGVLGVPIVLLKATQALVLLP